MNEESRDDLEVQREIIQNALEPFDRKQDFKIHLKREKWWVKEGY